jgi:NDP-sugar pyrophosphorylase family protein
MKIVIPMSGMGKRFTEKGYKDPKPLIDVCGVPMIYHVIDLFPGEHEFHFICNDMHLTTTKMREILLAKVPDAKIHSVSADNRKGPVDAVLQIRDSIAGSDEIIVSYCDYGTEWDYAAFLKEMREEKADGGIASYIGFHPHMLGTDHYAYMKHQDKWVSAIQEKKPFTDDKMSEYASNGTYYFRSADLMLYYFQKLVDLDLSIHGEYYVSMVYNLMIADSLRVRIFEIQKMLQWGTPGDLEEYLQWADLFHKKKTRPMKFRGELGCTLILPMAGEGSRFKMVGFEDPKPLLPVDGNPMVVEAVRCLPPTVSQIFLCRKHHLESYPIAETLKKNFSNNRIIPVDKLTEGQACTCEIALRSGLLPVVHPILISACDNGVYYNPEKFYTMLRENEADVIVWSFTNNRTSKLYPHMYAWLDVDENGFVRDVSIKKPFSDRENRHAIIGTMYFSNIAIFLEGLQDVYTKNLRTNGEFYVDNLLVPLIQRGYKVKVFEVDHYICWGTPNDYKTYLYWQQHFEKT